MLKVNYFFNCFSLILIFIGFFKVAAAQDNRFYNAISKKVQIAYNTEDPMNMYTLTAPAYQEKMSASIFINGTKNFYIKAGKWENLQFKEQTDGGMTYIAEFERETQLFFLKLDEQGRILRFNFKAIPFLKVSKNYQAASNNYMRTPLDSLVESMLRPYIQQGHTSGLSLAIIQKNKVYRYNYGEVRKGSGNLPDPQNTIYEIGSVTKTFTSLLLAIEVVNKNMDLMTSINNYLPKNIPPLNYKNTTITLQHLANHTSGFPRLPANIFLGNVDPANPYSHYKEDSLYSFLKTYQPTVIPGRQFSYSNYGAGLLGSILSEKAHKSFENLLLKKISQPLQMKDTRIELKQKDKIRLAQGYNEKGVSTGLWDLASLQGSGAIKSTLNDMVRYIQAQLGQFRNPLSKAILLTHQQTFQNKENTMGLGWRIEKRKNNNYWYHSGGTGGFRSFVGFDKKHELGVVILSNTAEDVTKMGQDILENSLDNIKK